MVIVLLLSLILLGYTLVGYPLLMSRLASARKRAVDNSGDPQPLTIVLCAKDEEANIGGRIDNLLAMDYPAELLEIVVVSDGSQDGTPKIVEGYADRNVRLVHYNDPRGKAHALNLGVAAATHNLLLMCDARQTFAPDVARKLVRYFADENVGAVSGRLIIDPTGGEAAGQGLGAYWDIEVKLRADESASGSVVGVTGAIYALRKACFEPLPEGTILDDVLIPMRAVLSGYRVLFEPEALAVDTKKADKKGELARKIRTLYGNLQLFDLEPRLFHPFANPIWWRFLSHKILRLFLPLFFLLCCVSSLLAGGIWFWFGLLQVMGWGAAAASWHYSIDAKPFRILATLFLLNLAIVTAWRNSLTGNKDVWGVASSNMSDGPDSDSAAKVKVLHVVDSLRIGGSESLVSTLVGAFRQRGIDNVVCGLGEDGPLRERLAGNECTAYNLDQRYGVRPDVMLRVGRIAMREQCNVIMTHHYRQLFHSLPAAVLLRKRLIHVEHDSHSYAAQPGLVNRLSKLAPFVQRFCFVSDEINQWFLRHMPAAADKFMVIPNGVDTERFAPDADRKRTVRQSLGIPEDAVVIGTCARLEPVKDLPLLLRSFALVSMKDGSECHLLIAGDGSLRDELKHLAVELGINDRCHFTGVVSDVPGILCAMDLYAITSANEGLPLSVLEAMSAALPVVSVNVGALEDVVSETTGILLEGRSDEECARAMQQLADDAPLRERLGSAAREFVLERYSLSAMVDAYEGIIRTK
ncbi:MAG: hypothetical protein CL942_06830 [Desulfovibrio sp.]|nr:hypothetical protein [Desulfovibrio sp.]|tara:strand:- start:30958 stop:33210 length:2253 start_codon:yes stop_codon:yes gene_type:complete